ncbi:MAG: zinc dependent phospholipase C family protein [Oscillospiraceae bacterium]|nr:zinc dependent phospholipase C family protein [Oscillospiraceae bacterium]
MASWMVHLRIADELLKKLNGIDETAFIVGSIAPDSGVPNADWSSFSPPKSVTHFHKRTEAGTVIDLEAYCERYMSEMAISGYNTREYSFFLGYYAHLLTDERWAQTISGELRIAYPTEYSENKGKLIEKAKEDWYDLDFRYLREHPDFRAFAVYENAAGFENEFMDIFAADAFENRREYITGFYRGDEHGELYRAYPYLTPERADEFVHDTSEWIYDTLSENLRR